MQIRCALLFVLCALLPRGLVFAQAHDHASPENLGKVNFSTSCSSAVQPQFNRAVALMPLVSICARH